MKPSLTDVFPLREWVVFSDQEISVFQYYFMDYFLENENKLSKRDVYMLACLANETQYQLRLLKSRISGDGYIDEESNDRYIKNICSFKDLFGYVKNKMVVGYEKTSYENKFELSIQPYSYFSATESLKDDIKKEFDSYFN